jgi:hypothetical protein
LEQLSKIILYNDPSTSNLQLTQLKGYLKSKINKIEIEIRDNFLNYYISTCSQATEASKSTEEKPKKVSIITELSKRLANTKVRDLSDPKKIIKPLLGEIAFEEKHLIDPSRTTPGILYDGLKLHELFQELLPFEEITRDICHIIFTPRLFGTFDENDRRYHARVILCGYPSIISTTGIVEAPAKPKEYYQIKQGLIRQNITTIDEFVPETLKEKYLKYNDPKITEVLKGYLMQVILYQLTSNPFCLDLKCRLFNAHWQEEVIKAQLTKPEFCSKHKNLISKIK